LAKAGVKIDYNFSVIRSAVAEDKIYLSSHFDTNISILKLFPGINGATVSSILKTPGLKGLVLETFGSGNAPSASWFIALLKEAIHRGVLILNISQCPGGMVIQGKYETSRALEEIGVVSGGDMTTEAAVTKLMLMLGEFGPEKAREMINRPLTGEISV
jgi:L-asparaginase